MQDNLSCSALWPKPEVHHVKQPHFLFLLTPPYSGSTAMAELLVTSPYVVKLCGNAEGHHLVPGMRQPGRWKASRFIDYDSVRTTWLANFNAQKKTKPKAVYVIEKSPPNMMRTNGLMNSFPLHSWVINNRNPYPACASYLYRSLQPDELRNSSYRLNTLLQAVTRWLERSARLRQLAKDLDTPVMTYEQFCEDPAMLTRTFRLPAYVCESVRLCSSVNVKDYTPHKIINHNKRQASLLSEGEQLLISEKLSTKPDLLDFFGYSCNPMVP